jgi:hypothetical protein
VLVRHSVHGHRTQLGNRAPLERDARRRPFNLGGPAGLALLVLFAVPRSTLPAAVDAVARSFLVRTGLGELA